MDRYRAYVLNEDDQIVRRHEFDAESADAAMKHARQYVDGHDVEVWLRTHIVGRLDHAT